MHTTWLSLVPPITVLAAVIITQELNLSVLIGIVIAALIVSQGTILPTIKLIGLRLAEQLVNIDALYLYAFLIIISSFICLLSYTGGAIAFARFITERLKSAKMVKASTALLSTALFIDDYLSILTVGYVMRPMTDRFHIPRAKLAYLIHSLSAPLVILAPVSSWVAMITGELEQAGINQCVTATTKIIGEPFGIYIKTIPFIFYSVLTIVSVWFIIKFNISYGPMHEHETIARTQKTMFGGKEQPQETLVTTGTQGSALDLILPIAVLIASVIGGILYSGDHYCFGGSNGFLAAFQENSHTEFVLFIASIIMLSVALTLALARNTIKLNVVPRIIKGGFDLMFSTIIMLYLVWALGNMLKLDLMTGDYLANSLLSNINMAFLPVMFYIISVIIAFITGSSWGTIALLIPIAIPMLTTMATSPLPLHLESVPLLLPILGAIFSGAVCGDHISPISALTNMTSNSSGSRPIDHIQTQLPYALPVIFSSACAYLMTGFLVHRGLVIAASASLGISIIICCLLLYAGHIAQKLASRHNT